LTEQVSCPTVWFALAKTFLAEGNLSAALQNLELAEANPNLLPVIFELLQGLTSDHPLEVPLLQAATRVGLHLNTLEALERAVIHAARWLETAPEHAEAIGNAMASAVTSLHTHGKEASETARAARWVWADALYIAGRPQDAASQLQVILAQWPEASQTVIIRASRWLQTAETLEVRLALIDAHLTIGDYEQALRACEQGPNDTIVAAAALVQRCRAVITGTESVAPAIAARAWALIATCADTLRDAQVISEACCAAIHLDPGCALSLSDWLNKRGWDLESRRILARTRGEILRDAGPIGLDQALDVYRQLLDADFVTEAEFVQAALARFPADYLPAWYARLDILTRQGAPYYPNAFAVMREILARFGPAQANALLDICRSLDRRNTNVYHMESAIYETAGNLRQAADTLLALQAVQPELFLEVEHAFEELRQRHPFNPELTLALGDAYCKAEMWDAALNVYLALVNAEPNLAPTLVLRFQEVLKAADDSIPARWGLSKGYRILAQPEKAAVAIEELTDRDASQSQLADSYLRDLLLECPDCGHGWYVRGKLAWLAKDCRSTIEYLECSLQKGGPQAQKLPLLHEMLGRAYQEMHDLEQALTHMRQAARLAPEALTPRQGLLSIRTALLDQLIMEKTAEVDRSSDPINAPLELAELLTRRGRHDEALAILQALLTSHGRKSGVHLALARCFASQGRYHLAERSYRQALECADLDIETRKATLYRLAQVLRQQLYYDEALAVVEELSGLDARYRDVLNLMDTICREKVQAQKEPLLLRLGGRFPQEL